MILRAITVEPLDNDKAKAQPEQPSDGGLLRRARSIFKPNKSANNKVKLATALAELTRMEQRRAQLIALGRVEGQAVEELLKELQSQMPGRPVSDGSDLEVFKKTYKEWLAKDVELSPKIQTLRQLSGGLSRRNTLARVDDPGHVAQLKGEFPEMKQVLCDAVCGKAAELHEEADRIAKEVQEELDTKYGTGEHDAEDQTPTKRARANCEYVNTLIKRVQVEPPESTYLDVVRYLLR
jgi:hypothetical protein